MDFNQNLNINDHGYINRLTNNQRQLINKINPSDTILYELTEYVLDRNRPYVETLMQRDGAGFLSTTYTYGNQRINTESINNLSGIYTYDGRGSVSAVIGGWGDFRATYWYDGLGNVKSQIHGYGAFGSGKRYFGYNAEQYNPVTGNQNLRARQVNIRRQRFLTEDTHLGQFTDTLSINRYIYGNDNPLKFKDPSGNASIPYEAQQELNNIYSEYATNYFVGIRNAIDATFDNIKNAVSDGINVAKTTVSNGISAYGGLVYNTFDRISSARTASNVLTKSLRIASSLSDSNLNGCYFDDDYNYDEFYDPNLPDYTDAINALLEREEQNYIDYRNKTYGVSTILGPIGLGSFTARAINMKHFYDLEQTGGDLDIKEQKKWKKVLGIETPWLGQNIDNEGARFIYNGEVMTSDILGNVTYGYWGKAMGFTDDEIYYGGGLAELKKKSGKSFIEFITDQDLMRKLALDPLYGDSPEDHYAIKRGIDLYYERHR